MMAISSLFIVSCGDDDDGMDITSTGNIKTYTLNALAGSGVSGEATFTELSNGSVEVKLDLAGTQAGNSHPAHIHINTAAEGGAIAISLMPVDGANGVSTTVFAELDNGTPITYSELLEFDGYINVHLSVDDLATIVAQGDIGQNELTGITKTYTLEERAVAGISGSVTFSERENGEALAQIILTGTPDGGSHPAHIHLNTAAEGGGIAYTFTPVDGSTGSSVSNISSLDDGTAFGYDDILGYDGYVNVHLSVDDLATIVAQGDIGQNELTGELITYDLDEKDVAGIGGTATFYERNNGEALAVLNLINTPDGGSHPAHIHANSASEGGPIIFTFNPVEGSSGISRTNVTMLDDESSIGYSDIETIDGYINVHLSVDDLATIVAQGDIGSNLGSSMNTNYDVTNSGPSAYVFNGSGFTDEENPDLTFQRGMTYTFTMDAAGHPFYIKTDQSTGTGNAYNSGVSSNGSESGTITFTVPSDAPNTLFYICEFHSSMTGTITITD
jgi:plastocyanin